MTATTAAIEGDVILDDAPSAVARGDWGSVDVLAGGFFSLLASSYPPPRNGKHRSVMPDEMRAFVTVLSQWPVDQWLAALERWQSGPNGGHRPYPAQIGALLAEKSSTAEERSLRHFRKVELLMSEHEAVDDFPAGDPHFFLAVEYCLKRDLPLSEAVAVREQMVN